MFKRFIRSSSLPKWDRNKVILAPFIAFRVTLVTMVTNVTLKAIKGASITLFLSHFGNEEDLINLLNMNAKFEEINSTTEDIILFNYISG